MERIKESDIRRIAKKIISEKEDSKKQDYKKESTIEKIIRKLKGISDDNLIYNMENNLPWDWKGTKEGYFEKYEPRKNSSGSN